MKIKRIFKKKLVIVSLLLAAAVVLVATNRDFLDFVEKAVEVKFSPTCLSSWWELLLKVHL